MSLLIDALQEVEQAEQKDKENELESDDSTYDSVNSSDEWADEFLPEFSQALTQGSSDKNESDSKKNYYEQPVDEFLDNTKTNVDTSLQDVDISSPLEKESETEIFSENEDFLLSESLKIESPELEQNLKKLIETKSYGENTLTASTEKTVADVSETIAEMDDEEKIIELAESIETESEKTVDLLEKQGDSVENKNLESTESEIPSSTIDKSDLLKDNQYVLSARTLMVANRANRKKWVYSLLFVMFAGVGWLGFSYYETLVALESGSSLSLPKAGNLRLKRPSPQQAVDEKNQQNEEIIASTESSKYSESVDFEENEKDTVVDNIVDKEAQESQSEPISPIIVPAVEFPIETTETAFFPMNENDLQKVAQTENAQVNENSEKIAENEEIKIIRKNRPRYLNVNLSKAYAAFQRGDDVTAKMAYTEVLRQDAKNRDALLGLAAIALRGNDFQQAQQFYQKVLLYYPQDKVAQVGLVATQGNRAVGETESHLKFLLSQSPQAAYIHFSLANFYAQQGHWTEAQQSYFTAFEHDNQRADYAYNLAVSLEHLQQQKSALHYYQQALQLAQFQSISFDIKITEQRIEVLKTQLNQ